MLNPQEKQAAETLGWQLTGEPVDLGVLEAMSGPAGPVIGDLPEDTGPYVGKGHRPRQDCCCSLCGSGQGSWAYKNFDCPGSPGGPLRPRRG